MTDQKRSEDLSPDDHAVLLALAHATAGGIEVPLPATAERARVREYLEVLGLLPYGLEPAAPSPEVKARLLATIGAPAAAEPAPQRTFDEVTFAGSPETEPFDLTFRRPAEPWRGPAAEKPGALGWTEPETPPAASAEPPAVEHSSLEAAATEVLPAIPAETHSRPREAAAPAIKPAAAEPAREEPAPASVDPVPPEPPALEPARPIAAPPAKVVPLPTAPASRGTSSRWLPALAAMLAVCVVGIAYLAAKVQQQSATIARLHGELQGLPIEDLSSVHAELSHMKRRFHMVTAVARYAYPMKTVEPLGPNVQTDGVVYVCGNHQRWYLNVQGLVPPPQGEEYHLWFVTDGGMVDGGVVEVGPDASSEMEAPTLPPGTHGFAITREKAGAPHDQPAGMMVLLAEESVSL